MKTGKNSSCLLFLPVALALLFFNTFAKAMSAAPPPKPTTAASTLDNLLTAFDHQSNANVRYLAYAKKADEEGFSGVASLFRAVANAEQVHFERYASVIRTLGSPTKSNIKSYVVKSTKENLEEALKGETYESTVMYPNFLARAKKDKIKAAVDAFEDAGAAEAVHAKWFKKALDNLDGWKQKKDFYVCPLCGNVVDSRTDAKCPICKTAVEKFILVN